MVVLLKGSRRGILERLGLYSPSCNVSRCGRRVDELRWQFYGSILSDFRVTTWGTSSPDDKLTGDLGKAIAATQICGCRLGPVGNCRSAACPQLGEAGPSHYRALAC